MEYTHIGQIIGEKIKEYANQVALRYKENDQWVSLTYGQMREKIQALSGALIRHGVQVGDRVGIYSANRYEWTLTDFACIMAGAISVPIYSTNTREQAAYIIEDADIRLIFTGDDVQYRNVKSLDRDSLSIVSYGDDFDLDPDRGAYFKDFSQVSVSDEVKKELARRSGLIGRDDVFTIIYTSGTTGNPKGVMLSHNNIFHQARVLDDNFSVGPKDVSLCFLPLSHVFERM
ncbi:MAG: AMP-binding protein, partial [Desulfovibrionales bacterium]|nr:AMP-binding protein [Desulfovibrionales bacterium]